MSFAAAATTVIFLIVCPLCLVLYYTARGAGGAGGASSEGFQSSILPPDVVQAGQLKYNPLAALVNPAAPAITPATGDVQGAFQSLDAQGAGEGAYSLVKAPQPAALPAGQSPFFQLARQCEAITDPNNCAAFDDPTFAANCGMSFDLKGVGSAGTPHIGGLYTSPEDRAQGQPTLGTAAPGMFATSKAQCQVMSEEVQCKQRQSFGVPNCSQCFLTQEWGRLDPSAARVPPSILAIGSGVLTLVGGGGRGGSVTLDPSTPSAPMSLAGLQEGETFVLELAPSASEGAALPWLSAVLTAPTAQGTYTMDLAALVDVDLQTNYKPALAGSSAVQGTPALIMQPAQGQQAAKFKAFLPFTFVSPSDPAAATCTGGPFVTTNAAAQFMSADTCFTPQDKPGSYSAACLQQKFVQLGCTTQGTGYPSTAEKAAALNQGAPTIDQISNTIYEAAVRASTGRSTKGDILTLQQWNDASQFCSGKTILSPCDTQNKAGPLSQGCLSYIYTNSGAGTAFGATYTLPATYASGGGAAATAPVYCKAGAGLDPATPGGFARSVAAGGVDAVKALYDQASRLANDATKTPQERAQAIADCYGPVLDPAGAPEVFPASLGAAGRGAAGLAYNVPYSQAEAVCQSYGGRMATLQELQSAMVQGAQWCMAGWVQGDQTTGYYPMQKKVPYCGAGQGVQTYSAAQNPPRDAEGNILFAVNCFGPPPPSSAASSAGN